MPFPMRIRKTEGGLTFPLTQGLRVLVCEEGLERVRDYSWYVDFNNRGTPYAHSKATPGNVATIRAKFPNKGPTSTFTMHCFLRVPSEGMVVHHINGNTLDNRLSNLVVTTPTLNNAAQSGRGGTSKYKGVFLRGKRWVAQIQIAGKKIPLGRYDDEIEAAVKYDSAARELFGPLAAINFPNISLEG